MEKIYGIIYKGEETIGDNFLTGLSRDLRDSGLFLVYQTTTRPPTRLRVIHEKSGGDSD